MIRNSLLLVVCLLISSATYGQSSYNEAFRKALDANDLEAAEKIIYAWDFADANDPELYVGYFNFYTIKSLHAGGGGYEKENAQKALEFITLGIERFPTRFDMRVAKIYMLNGLKDFNAFTDEVIKLIDYSAEIANDWKGEGFRLIEEPVEMFYGAVMDFQEKLYKENTMTCYDKMLRISEKMLKHYPRHTQSMLNMSTAYVLLKDYNKSIETLLKAVEIEPKNAIYLYNLAYVYQMKGELSQAKKYYAQTVANAGEKEEKLKESAKKRLNELK